MSKAIDNQVLEALANGGMLDSTASPECKFSAVNLIFDLLLSASNHQEFYIEVYKNFELSGCLDKIEDLQSTT